METEEEGGRVGCATRPPLLPMSYFRGDRLRQALSPQRREMLRQQQAMNMTDFKERSKEARDDGIDRAESNADEMWLQAAHMAALLCVQRGQPFTTDDVWMAMPEKIRSVKEPRAMGGVMRRLRRDRLAEPMDQFESTDHIRSHRRPKRLWMPIP